MTTAALNDTATVRDLLFGGMPVEPTDALAESLRQHGTLKTVVPGFPGLTAAVEREVATEAGGVLSLDLFDMAMAGWKRYEALRGTARRTRDAPKTEEIVALATHRIESSHHPTIEVFIDGKSVATIEVELTVAFGMAGVLAVVRQARLTAIRSGNCTAAGKLAIKGTIVAQRGQRRFDLPGAVRLRHGVALLDPSTGATPVEQAVVSRVQSTSPAAWCPDPTG